MLSLKDLKGIKSKKKEQAIKCLDELLTFKDSDGELNPIITGYNFYSKIPSSRYVLTLSHIHETNAYFEDMSSDLEKLGYNREQIINAIRDKAGAYLHALSFRIRDDSGKLYQDIKIKDTITGKYLDLNHYQMPLKNYSEFENKEGCLICENNGWELDISFKNKKTY